MDISRLTFDGLIGNLQKKKEPAGGGIRIAILMDSVSQYVAQMIECYGVEHGVSYEIFEAGFGQIDQQIYNPSSELYSFSPDFIFVLRTTDRLLDEFYKAKEDERVSFASDQLSILSSQHLSLRSRTKAGLIFSNFSEFDDSLYGSFANNTDRSFLYQLRKLNLLMMEWAQREKEVYICDICSLAAAKGHDFCVDERFLVRAGMNFSLDFAPLIARRVHDMIQSLRGRIRKCIILDLDNTLWGGVIGDDGVEHIQIGQLGIGKAFSRLQRWVRELSRRGVIVAICSKNSEEVARVPFLSHPEMVLTLNDIAIFLANWENKADNIRRIGETLNIGFDSMVFVDDSVFEREMIRSAIPEIEVPALPEDAALYLSYLQSLNLFDSPYLTDQDRKRTRQYQEEAGRARAKTESSSEDDFLLGLKMKSAVRLFDDYTIPRIAQLAQRTNQFNLRTVRYSESDLAARSKNEEYTCLSFTLEDIYGDYGLIAAIILYKESPDVIFIENWMMSCRAFKRGMEEFTLVRAIAAAGKAGCRYLEGEYIPTDKNMPVKNLFQELGFLPGYGNRWRLTLDGMMNKLNYHIHEITN